MVEEKFISLVNELASQLVKKCPIAKVFRLAELMSLIKNKLKQEIQKVFTEYQHFSVEEYYNEEDFFTNLLNEIENLLLLKMPLYDEQFHNRFMSKIESLTQNSFEKIALIYAERCGTEIDLYLPPVLSQIISSYIA